MTWYIKRFDELTSLEMYRILQERTAIFVVEQNCPYQEVDGKDLASYHLYKEENGEIVAYSRLLPAGIAYTEASIGRVIVKREYRGKGLAQELFRKSIEFIQYELKEDKIKIQAQHYLEKFYNSYGFEPISDVYLEDDIPHIDMMRITTI